MDQGPYVNVSNGMVAAITNDPSSPTANVKLNEEDPFEILKVNDQSVVAADILVVPDATKCSIFFEWSNIGQSS